MTYLLILTAIVLAPAIFFVVRELRWRRRETALRALLDGADELESQLQQCRTRMQELRTMLVDLPEEMSADADFALAADDKVQAALRDLLQHRLWIQKNAIDADQAELDTAVAALGQSRTAMGQQLQRLNEISAELRAAQGHR